MASWRWAMAVPAVGAIAPGTVPREGVARACSLGMMLRHRG